MKRVFARDQDKEVAELYQSGMSSIKLAQRFGVDKSSILNALKRQGVRRRRSQQEPEQKDIITGLKDFGNRLLTPGEVDQAYKIYSVGGFSLNAISHAYGFGKNGRGLAEAFKRQGYERRGGKGLTEEQEEKAIELYGNGLSGTQVAKELEVPKYLIKSMFKRRDDFEKRKHTTVFKHDLNETIFDTIDTEEKAYWIGYIYAEGCVVDNKVFAMGISIVDKDHLLKLRDFLGASHTIYHRKSETGYSSKSETVYMHINHYHLGETLQNLGIVKARNHFYRIEQSLPEHLYHHFILGYLDGDGCLRGNYNPSVTFVGQQDILEWIRMVFHKGLDTNPNLSILKGKGIYSINYVGINQSTLICQWLYRDATVWLQRKRDKFEDWPEPKGKRRLKH